MRLLVVEDEHKLAGVLKRGLEEIIGKHTNQPVEKVSKDMERDYYMTAEDAQQYGIVDQVIAHR